MYMLLFLVSVALCSTKYNVILHHHHHVHPHILHHHPDNTSVHHVFTSIPGYTFSSNRSVSHIKKDPRVRSIEPDQRIVLRSSVQQTNPPSWGLDRINQRTLPLDQMYSYPASAGQNATVYVVDSGIYLQHQEFQGRATWGLNTVNTVNTDENGHGTHVSGIIGGITTGVAKKVNLVAVKVMDAQGQGSISNVLQGLDFVASQTSVPSKLISMSLGGDHIISPALSTMLQGLIQMNIPVIVAAGNAGDNSCAYTPINVPGTFVVAASDENDNYAAFSDTGPCIDLIAPGVNIVSSYIGAPDAYTQLSGTSMATPHVTGVAAIIWPFMFNLSQLTRSLMSQATQNVIQNDVNTVNALLYSS